MPRLFEELKPFAWMAVAAFMAGLASYVFVGGGGAASANEPVAIHASVPQAAGPASAEWNLPKRI